MLELNKIYQGDCLEVMKEKRKLCVICNKRPIPKGKRKYCKSEECACKANQLYKERYKEKRLQKNEYPCPVCGRAMSMRPDKPPMICRRCYRMSAEKLLEVIEELRRYQETCESQKKELEKLALYQQLCNGQHQENERLMEECNKLREEKRLLKEEIELFKERWKEGRTEKPITEWYKKTNVKMDPPLMNW